MSSSESEEFFDAEDITPSHGNRKHIRIPKGGSLPRSGSDPCISNIDKKKHAVVAEKESNNVFVEPSSAFAPPVGGRRRFKDIRQRLQTDDEDGLASNITPPDSQTSSVEGVYPAVNRTSHPFRIIEHDTLSLQSINSLGRVGRILGGLSDPGSAASGGGGGSVKEECFKSVSALSTSSRESGSGSTPSSKEASQYPSTVTLSTTTNVPDSSRTDDAKPTVLSHRCFPLQPEPDVIASTKSSGVINACINQKGNSASDGALLAASTAVGGPVAPPRRKKKLKAPTPPTSLVPPSVSSNDLLSSSLASPASTIESLTREFEHSLDNLPVKNLNNNVANNNNSANANETTNTEFQRDKIKSNSLRSGHSLDIRQLTKGLYVVKPQDDERASSWKICEEDLRTNKAGSEQNAADAQSAQCDNLRYELASQASCTGGAGGGTNPPLHRQRQPPRYSNSNNSIGHYSLGPHRTSRHHYLMPRGSKERRKSAGDETMLNSLNMFVRTRTDSGKQLTDMEILEQVTVLNLDTGERVPLSIAEDKLPQCINPLSLHIMRLTSEYVSTSSLDKENRESDEESVCSKKSEMPMELEDTGRVRKKTAKLKRFLGSTVKKTMVKAKSIAQEVSHARHKEDVMDIVDEVNPGEQNIKLKASNSHKGPYELENIQHVQELKDEHVGPIWCMKFSCCGRLLATAGQDRILRIWIVREAFPFFQDMRTKYNAEKVSPTPSQESLVSHHSSDDANVAAFEALKTEEGRKSIFMPKPFCTYTGHTSDLLDVSWSKNYFILSSSMDKTVRLWHISRKECLCCFQHIDFVTAIVFHPRDDRYFLSGSLDGKLRLWNIPDKKVAVWNEVEGTPKLITAANFCQNGKFAVVGSYDGRCIFYITDQLKYHTQIHVRSSRGRNSTGRKISGIEPMPGEDKILVTSNDSRIRLYDLRDLSLSCKYKGYVNISSQIKASFSHDGKYIVSGSENRDIYVWKTNHDYSKFSSVRRDRNDFWEAIKAHNAVVTCAVFAPNPDSLIKMFEDSNGNTDSQQQQQQPPPPQQEARTEERKVEDPMVEQHTKGCGGHVLVSADFNGCIKVFINKMKPKHSSLPASALA